MGLLSGVKHTISESLSKEKKELQHDRDMSPKADLGRSTIGAKPSYKVGLFDAIGRKQKADLADAEKREKAAADAKAAKSWKPKIQKGMASFKAGYGKFEKGKAQFGGFMKDMQGLIPDEKPSKSRHGRYSSNDMFGFDMGGFGSGSGISKKDLLELQGLSGLSGGSMFGNGGNTRRHKTRHKQRHHKKSHRRAAPKARSIFDIDI